MTASEATSGFGCLLKKGDSGVGAGTAASVEWGTSNQKIRIKWKIAGEVGNGKNITVAVTGSSFVATTISSTAISITVPTSTTVAQTIAFLYQQSGFSDYWDADYGATPGDGSGTVTARTVTATSGGVEGTEVFTTVAEVKSIQGPNTQTAVVDVTHMGSDDNTREFLPTLIDPGDLSFNVNFLPGNATHTGLRTDQKNRTRRNWKLVFTDAAATTYSFAGYVTGVNISSEIEGVLGGAITLKLTSFAE